MKFKFYNGALKNTQGKFPESLKVEIYPRDGNRQLNIRVGFRDGRAWVSWPATWEDIGRTIEFAEALHTAAEIGKALVVGNGYLGDENETYE